MTTTVTDNKGQITTWWQPTGTCLTPYTIFFFFACFFCLFFFFFLLEITTLSDKQLCYYDCFFCTSHNLFILCRRSVVLRIMRIVTLTFPLSLRNLPIYVGTIPISLNRHVPQVPCADTSILCWSNSEYSYKSLFKYTCNAKISKTMKNTKGQNDEKVTQTQQTLTWGF